MGSRLQRPVYSRLDTRILGKIFMPVTSYNVYSVYHRAMAKQANPSGG
jgi:hypothetical protein